ncbi:MAG: hypothetical protein KatS3mg030_344 [Saprospiraceae bacterium]|nr:MAG: hypothetical protein KatS3mg030_344 [Saprospiraceae bacterium]
MLSLEQEIKQFLKESGLTWSDGSSSFKRLDFTIQANPALGLPYDFHFDAKEKRQHYNLSNWGIPNASEERCAFIIDDLAARKILAYAPYSGMVVRDNLEGGYYLFSVLDLFLMPKTRVNRPIEKEKPALKGKWIIDLRNGRRCESLEEVLAAIRRYIDQRKDLFLNILECYGDYVGEQIDQRGIVRRPDHWDTDVSQTR